MLDVLSQEVYGPVHIDGADERDQLEVELLGAEWEQEGTVLENLLHSRGNGTLNEIVRILDASLQI